jgi:hypothetical protein
VRVGHERVTYGVWHWKCDCAVIVRHKWWNKSRNVAPGVPTGDPSELVPFGLSLATRFLNAFVEDCSRTL